jgi:mediator of RNA polymerase II transcription subunit 14
MLRDTLPMALELESLTRDDANKPGAEGLKVDVFPKACGWYRVLLGDLRSVHVAGEAFFGSID